MKYLVLIMLILVSAQSWAEGVFELKVKDRLVVCEIGDRESCIHSNRPLRDVRIELNYSDRGKSYLTEETFENLDLRSLVRIEKNVLRGEETCKVLLLISWSKGGSTRLASERFQCEQLSTTEGKSATLTAVSENFRYTYEAVLYSKDTLF